MALSVQTGSRIGTNLTSAGTAQQVTTIAIQVRSCIFYAASGNTGDLYISPNSTGATAILGITLSPGEAYSIAGDIIGGEQKTFDLSTWRFDGSTTNDDLVIQYWA